MLKSLCVNPPGRTTSAFWVMVCTSAFKPLTVCRFGANNVPTGWTLAIAGGPGVPPVPVTVAVKVTLSPTVIVDEETVSVVVVTLLPAALAVNGVKTAMMTPTTRHRTP